jgi:hypothetical protein
MQHALMLARIETLREEIKLIQNQQRFYRTVKRCSIEQSTENIRREILLLELQAELVLRRIMVESDPEEYDRESPKSG